MPRTKSNVSLVPLILSCEHYGTRIPSEMQHILAPGAWVLKTHRGSDIGIAPIFEALKGRVTQHCYFHEISRLIVDANRSADNPEVFSKYTRLLSDSKKQKLLKLYHEPHRRRVSECVGRILKKSNYVLHLSLHSFTPCLRGQRRDAQIGLLFDPARHKEARFCKALKSELLKLSPRMKVRMNYPYKGTDDGLTVTLRKSFGPEYIGIELELNQNLIRTRSNLAVLLSSAIQNCRSEALY